MIRIDTAGLRRSLVEIERAVIKASNDAVAEAVAAGAEHARATTLFHNVTGDTRHSIESAAFAGYGHVSAGGAALFLENGTAAHAIEARNAQTLRFVVNGETVFRRSVQHPGTEPRPFMTQARDEGERVLAHNLEGRTASAVREH